MEFSEDRIEIFKGLQSLRKKLIQPTFDAEVEYKTNNGGRTQFKYATLKAIIDAIDKAADESESGISWQQEATTENNEVVVMTLITHTSGQYIIHGPLKFPKNGSNPQSAGSVITYAKRYALASAFGIAADSDNDGKTDLEEPDKKENNSSNELSEAQVTLGKSKIMEFITLSQIDSEAFKNLILHDLSFELSEVSSLTTNNFQKLMNYLNKEIPKLKNNQPQSNNSQQENFEWGKR